MRVDCNTARMLMMKRLDGEITPVEDGKLHAHLKQCVSCGKEWHQFHTLKGVTGEMKKRLLPEMAWEEYWRHLYNRMERGIAWMLISLGLIILLGYASIDFVRDILHSTALTPFQKVGVFALMLGTVVLFVSVLREKLMVRRHDRYREVQR